MAGGREGGRVRGRRSRRSEGWGGRGGGQQPWEVLLDTVAAARGVAAHQPAPPAAGSLLGVAAGVSSHRDIPAIEEEPLVAGIEGLPAGLRCEGLRSPSLSLSGGDGRPRILLACCVAFLRLHRNSCLICTEGYLFISSATAKRKEAGEAVRARGMWWWVRRAGWRVGAAGQRCAPSSSQPSRQDATNAREPHTHMQTRISITSATNLDCVFPRRTQWRRWQKRGGGGKLGPSFHTFAAAAVAVDDWPQASGTPRRR